MRLEKNFFIYEIRRESECVNNRLVREGGSETLSKVLVECRKIELTFYPYPPSIVPVLPIFVSTFSSPTVKIFGGFSNASRFSSLSKPHSIIDSVNEQTVKPFFQTIIFCFGYEIVDV